MCKSSFARPELCLGTAQFGLAYGITNTTGKLSAQEVFDILAVAEVAGIQLLDSAQAYGDAEAILGRVMRKEYNFRIISKLQAQSNNIEFNADDVSRWEHSFKTSLSSLGVKSIDAFLLHSVADLSKHGGNLLEEWLLSLRDRKLVKRLGVSIYCAEDLVAINPNLLDLVQLPLSLYDQRLIADGTITRLRAEGVAIHARSIFLQGLLLTPASKWPTWLDEQVRCHHNKLDALAKYLSCTLMDLCLSFAAQQSDLEAIVLGVCSIFELEEIILKWNSLNMSQVLDWQSWALRDNVILDPRKWPK